MPARDTRDLTKEMSKLTRSVENWRRRDDRSRRLPAEVWDQAIAAAEKYGVGAVVRHVGLDHAKLKAKLAEKRATQQALTPVENFQASFFELIPPPAEAAARCVVEVESGRGARMRLELSRLEMPGLLDLVRGFVA
jgi:hypothetical protein